MNARAVLRVLGGLALCAGATFILPIAFALHFGEGDVGALALAAAAHVGLGLVLWRLPIEAGELRIREGFAIVTFGWLLLTLLGTLPYLLCGKGIGFTDAFFETMSGYTTTGATILSNVESLPHGVLMWRSLTHWLGGMGIILLSLAILPMLGVGGMQLFKAEVPGPSVDKLQPRIQDTAKALWGVYALVTAAEAILLKLGGMSVFDSLCHTFGTVATGGFSTKNAGIAHFNSAYIESVITVFMLLAGTNFALHYRALRGHLSSYARNEEFRFYLAVVAGVSAMVCLDLTWRHGWPLADSVQKSLFQVSSLLTTTGYHSADYERWSPSSQLFLVSLMFLGGCAGSTGGGMKVVRVYLMVKYGLTQFKKLLHPHAVIPVRLGGKPVSAQTLMDIQGFLLLYVGVFLVASWAMSLLGLDFVTSFSSVISTLGNIGPGVGSVGPTENYAHIPWPGKWILSFLMLIGRLELYTVLVIFSQHFWTK